MAKLTSKAASLRRDVGWFGSFAMGYGDVGPNIFVALGVITLFAGGGAPIAFLVAALIYICVGAAYAELAPTYPYAGGVHVYALKASNTLVGFISGWGMMLSYLLCISLFSVAAAGYLTYQLPILNYASITVMGYELPPVGVVASILTLILLILNYVGIRYSAFFLSALVLLGLSIEAAILAAGYILKFRPELFISQITKLGGDIFHSDVSYLPWLNIQTNNFLYAITLAMSSFIGIESIAQAAEETRRPQKAIPKSAKATVATVTASALLFTILATGSLDWRIIASSLQNPVSTLVNSYPLLGQWMTPIVSIAAFILCYASSNTGVIGLSRIVSSMGRFNLLPRWLHNIHPRFRTPTRPLTILGPIAILLALPGDIPFLASLYAFGALLSYVILTYCFIKLRNVAVEDYRPWKVPGSIKYRGLEIPVLGLLGLVGTSAAFTLFLIFHAAGRNIGLAWMAAGLASYVIARKLSKMKLISRDESLQIAPMGYKMKVAVLVRPYEDLDVVKSTIYHGCDRRFLLKLVSVVEANGSDADLENLQKRVAEDLQGLADSLKGEGYEVEYKVVVGDFEAEVSKMLDTGEVDMIAYIQRRTGKAVIEKGHEQQIHRIMTAYPGKTMSLRRVG
ncbi:putative amino acid permease YhdG [archaeon HR01]|nr:putative amino acid permease YhdG [archaeon HR01]